jgi:hypothetical protein
VLQEPAAPRIWTPRQASPPRDSIVRRPSLSGGNDYRDATPPPISLQPSPTWEPSNHGRPGPGSRYPNEDRPQRRLGNPRDATLDADVRWRQQTNEHIGPGRDRFNAEPEAYRPGTLEGRLGDRYDIQDSFVEAVRQPHALPPNPTLHPDHHPIAHDSRRKSFPDRRPSNQERSQTGWVDAASHSVLSDARDTFGDEGSPPRDARKRSRRVPPPNTAPQDDPISMGMDVEELPLQYSQQRPGILRRGGSLLDRLSLDQNDDTTNAWSSSLRDRVQVPSKRNRDEMIGVHHQPDHSFGDDGNLGDPAALKKPRRRNPNKFRRGAKRGGMA